MHKPKCASRLGTNRGEIEPQQFGAFFINLLFGSSTTSSNSTLHSLFFLAEFLNICRVSILSFRSSREILSYEAKMPATSTLFRAARPAFRSQQFFSSSQAQAQIFRTTRSRFQNYGSKRWQSTAAPAAETQSWAKRMWDSPIGLKTVHFWWVYGNLEERSYLGWWYGC